MIHLLIIRTSEYTLRRSMNLMRISSTFQHTPYLTLVTYLILEGPYSQQICPSFLHGSLPTTRSMRTLAAWACWHPCLCRSAWLLYILIYLPRPSYQRVSSRQGGVPSILQRPPLSIQQPESNTEAQFHIYVGYRH